MKRILTFILICLLIPQSTALAANIPSIDWASLSTLPLRPAKNRVLSGEFFDLLTLSVDTKQNGVF